MNKLRKGDQVIVIAGRDKGKRGTIARRVDDTHLIVEGVNVVKKHVKPNPMKGTTGGVTDKNMPIDQSNVAIYNPATGKADRVGIKLLTKDEQVARKTRDNGVRVFKSSGKEIGAK
jgi:large subunit ribosomal protein L24